MGYRELSVCAILRRTASYCLPRVYILYMILCAYIRVEVIGEALFSVVVSGRESVKLQHFTCDLYECLG